MSAPLVRRELSARRGRFVWLTVAVTTAVAFTVGGFAFSALLGSVLAPAGDLAADAALLPAGSVVITARTDAVTTATALDDGLLGTVRGVPGVGVAQGSFDQPLALRIAPERQRDRPTALRGLVLSSTFDGRRWTLVDGRAPRGSDEIALDAAGFEVAGVATASGEPFETQLYFPTGLRTVVVVGRVAPADAVESAKGPPDGGGRGFGIAAGHAVLDDDVAARLLDAEGRVDRITATPLPGTDPEDLEARLRAGLPNGVRVISASSRAASTQHSIERLDSSIQRAVAGFALATVLIAGMVVVNTLSVLVAQRVREFAMLRIVGAGRGHIVRVVLGQALVVGAIGTVVGLGLGAVLGHAAARVVGTGGVAVPLLVNATMVAAAIGVGVGVTAIGALVPALRAGRVSPLAALSDTRIGADRAPRWRVPLAAVCSGSALVAVGFGFGRGGVRPEQSVQAVLGGSGSVLVFGGLAGLSRWVVVPMLAGAHAVISVVGGVASGLGVGNARRQPSRTVGSASTLMVGLALVGFVATLGASVRSAVLGQFESSGRVDLYLERRGVVRVSPFALEGRLARELRGRGSYASLTSVDGSVVAGDATVDQPLAVDFGALSDLADLDVRAGAVGSQVADGSPDALGSQAEHRGPGPGSIALARASSERLGVGVGDTVTLRTVSGDESTFVVGGIYANTSVAGPAIVDLNSQLDRSALGTFELGLLRFSGRDRPRAVERAARLFPLVRVHTPAGFGALNAAVVDTVLRVLGVVLVAMIGIGCLGVVATLGLATLERRRQLVMLRAIGASRRQIRSMVRAEAILIGALAAVVGLVSGVTAAVAVVRFGELEIATDVVVPWPLMATVGVFSIAVSLVVSLGVALRASLVPPAEAGL